jgi:hypothetical protein
MAAVFPLVPRRRVIGLAFGGVRSARRGVGSDVASTREYRPGDDVAWMDWAASARLSAARGTDEFIVRERFADEAPRVVVLCDRRPSMSFGESPLRRLDKPRAILTALDLIDQSAVAARSLTGYLDYAEGEPYWRAPRTESRAEPGTFERSFPDVGGITVPYADPSNGSVVPVYLTNRETIALRREHEARWDGLVRDFRSLGTEPVAVHRHDLGEMLGAFLRWADVRQMWRGAVA